MTRAVVGQTMATFLLALLPLAALTFVVVFVTLGPWWAVAWSATAFFALGYGTERITLDASSTASIVTMAGLAAAIVVGIVWTAPVAIAFAVPVAFAEAGTQIARHRLA